MKTHTEVAYSRGILVRCFLSPSKGVFEGISLFSSFSSLSIAFIPFHSSSFSHPAVVISSASVGRVHVSILRPMSFFVVFLSFFLGGVFQALM